MTLHFNNQEITTGLFKKATIESVFLNKTNVQGDGQADLVHHGGEDKAVCVYPFEHYCYWEDTLNQKLEFGAFGENITVIGMTERDVCIGDVFQIGEAVVQISQPRQPCYKLAARYDRKELPVMVQTTGFTGYYFRVLTEGLVAPNAKIQLLEPHSRKRTVQWANEIMYHDKTNVDGIKALIELDVLSTSWRKTLQKRIAEY